MLKCMLWGFGISMKMLYALAALMDKNFKNRLKERNMQIVIKTKDGSVARTFSLQGGVISSAARDCADPDLCITWGTSGTLFGILLKLKPEKVIKAGVDAIKSGDLKVEFKVAPFMWFSKTLMQMMTVFTDRTKPKKFLFINA